MPADFELSPIQIETLIMLDLGGDYQDNVGRRIEELCPRTLLSALILSGMGLVVCSRGWDNSLWFRLTPRGQVVRNAPAG